MRWYINFIKRHPEILIREAESLNKARAINILFIRQPMELCFGSQTHAVEAIDLCLCDTSLSAKLFFETEKHLFGSDHMPIAIKSTQMIQNFIPKWKITHANWEPFSNHITDYKEDSIDEINNSFTELIITVANIAVGKTKRTSSMAKPKL